MESDPSLLKKYQPVVLCSVTIRRSSCDYFLLDADALIWFAVCVDVLMMSDPRSSSDSCGSVLLYQCSTEPNLGYKPLSRPNLFKCFLWKQWPLSLLGLDFSSFVFFFLWFDSLFSHGFILIQVGWLVFFLYYYYLKDVYVSERRINNKRHIQKCKVFFYM